MDSSKHTYLTDHWSFRLRTEQHDVKVAAAPPTLVQVPRQRPFVRESCWSHISHGKDDNEVAPEVSHIFDLEAEEKLQKSLVRRPSEDCTASHPLKYSLLQPNKVSMIA